MKKPTILSVERAWLNVHRNQEEQMIHIHDCTVDGVPVGTPFQNCEECYEKERALRAERAERWTKRLRDEAASLETRERNDRNMGADTRADLLDGAAMRRAAADGIAATYPLPTIRRLKGKGRKQ